MSLDPTVVAAIIGGAAAIIAPLLAVIVTKVINEGKFNGISEERRKTLAGTWRGEMKQLRPDGALVAEVSITLAATRHIVSGSGQIQYSSNGQNKFVAFEMKGGFQHDRFLELTYKNSRESARQFGSIMLELDYEGQSFTGKFVGFGAETKRIVAGEVELKKI